MCYSTLNAFTVLHVPVVVAGLTAISELAFKSEQRHISATQIQIQ
jgi:hypothetical protein